YDTSGNTAGDGVNAYTWDGESQLKTAGGGRRASKVGSKLYWYGSGGEILAETDASGNTTAEYIFFGGKRIAQLVAGTAAPIIQNASFETHNTLDQSFSGGSFNQGGIPGWNSGSQWDGSLQPNSQIFHLPLPDGSILGSVGDQISQTLTGVSLQPNHTYTLS